MHHAETGGESQRVVPQVRPHSDHHRAEGPRYVAGRVPAGGLSGARAGTQGARRHLRPGGRVVVDARNGSYGYAEAVERRTGGLQ